MCFHYTTTAYCAPGVFFTPGTSRLSGPPVIKKREAVGPFGALRCVEPYAGRGSRDRTDAYGVKVRCLTAWPCPCICCRPTYQPAASADKIPPVCRSSRAVAGRTSICNTLRVWRCQSDLNRRPPEALYTRLYSGALPAELWQQILSTLQRALPESPSAAVLPPIGDEPTRPGPCLPGLDRLRHMPGIAGRDVMNKTPSACRSCSVSLLFP